MYAEIPTALSQAYRMAWLKQSQLRLWPTRASLPDRAHARPTSSLELEAYSLDSEVAFFPHSRSF